jgi:predicted CopG family antitoxin
MNQVKTRHTITIDDKTFQILRSKGNFGETYSDVISRIIEDSDADHGQVKER